MDAENLIRKERAEGFTDSRQFVLLEYRHGHAHAVFRGFPEVDPDGDVSRPRVMDVVFAGLGRLSCWKDIGAIDLRIADKPTQEMLMERFDGDESDGTIFLLTSDSVEDYVVADTVYWAEYDLWAKQESPLVSRDPEYRAANPPVGGVIYHAT